MTCRRGSAFTLIELLVVIAIIAVLVALLMPSLQGAKVLAGVVSCQTQMKMVGVGFQHYCSDFNDYLLWTSAVANHETTALLVWNHNAPDPATAKRIPNGFALLYLGEYVEDHRHFYCPTAITGEGSGWGDTFANNRRKMIDNFEKILAAGAGAYDLRCDYAIGYWVQEGDSYYSPYPRELRDKEPTLSVFRKGGGLTWHGRPSGPNNIWFADASDWQWSRPYHPISHNAFQYQNIGKVDGAVTVLRDVNKKAKFLQSYSHNYERYANERPIWGWWEYYNSVDGAGEYR